MNSKDDNSLEIRRKGIEAIFDLIFLFMLFYFLGNIIFEDMTLSLILNKVETLLLLFACTRLSHNGDFFAGILGIVIGIVEFLFGGIVFQISGILLIIDSIMYLVFYSKFKNNKK